MSLRLVWDIFSAGAAIFIALFWLVMWANRNAGDEP